MNISGIDFDKELLDALENKKLVIFAGAGVSIGKPANLMNFVGLARLIGKDSSIKYSESDKESPEIYLGKLKNEGIKIYELLGNILLHRDRSHTSLHENLIKIFNDYNKVRIVTTNYDLFFEEAFKSLTGKDANIYSSPALPLGRDFTGIVHLHGALHNDPNGLVLTDDDFGRAYLTEGWARRFLRDVFENFTVLFIGYSHEDTIVKYLARALPPSDNKRFLLEGENSKKNHWEHLKIEPIRFPQVSNSDFSSLKKFIEEIVNLNSKGALEVEKLVSETISSPTEMDNETESFVHWFLTKDHTTRFFCDYANDTSWLDWMSDNGYLNFFEENLDLTKSEKYITEWFSNFAIEEPQKAIEILFTGKNPRNIILFKSIILKLNSDKIKAEPLTLWLPLLIPKILPDLNMQYHIFNSSLFNNIKNNHLSELLLFLLEVFTQPIVKAVANPYNLRSDKRVIDFQIEYPIDEFYFTKLLNCIEFFQNDLALDVYHILLQSLNKSFNIHKIYGNASKNYDPQSSTRSAIEPHEQDKYPEKLNDLIDLFRNSAETLIKINHYSIDTEILILLNHDSKLLKRIGIHLFSLSNNYSHLEKIKKVIHLELLADYTLKHETYQLLGKSFKELKKTHKKQYLKKLLDTNKKIFRNHNNATKEDIAYQNFNLLTWLSNSDTECKSIKEELNIISKNYPEFKPREYLDLTIWTSDVPPNEFVNPIDKSDLLKLSASEVVDYIHGFTPSDNYINRSFYKLITQAINKNLDWGLKLANEIILTCNEDQLLFNSILDSFEKLELIELLQDNVYQLFVSESFLKYSNHSISRLIRDKLDKTDSIDRNSINKIDSLLNELWTFAIKKEPDINSENWLNEAINHPVGNISLCWIKLIARSSENTRLQQEIFDTRLTNKILNNSSNTKPLGHAILGSNYTYLSAANDDWVKNNLIELFSFKNNPHAKSLWDGWLTWGRLSIKSLIELQPYYIEAISNIDFKLIDRFCVHLANIIFYASDDPIDEIIFPFIRSVNETQLSKLSKSINQLLSKMSDEKKEYHWGKWLKKYFYYRSNNIPKELSEDEYVSIIDTVIYLDNLFNDAVESFIKFTPHNFKYNSAFHKIREKGLHQTKPADTIKLLLHILKIDVPPHFCHDLKGIYNDMNDAMTCDNNYLELGNRLTVLNCI